MNFFKSFLLALVIHVVAYFCLHLIQKNSSSQTSISSQNTVKQKIVKQNQVSIAILEVISKKVPIVAQNPRHKSKTNDGGKNELSHKKIKQKYADLLSLNAIPLFSRNLKDSSGFQEPYTGEKLGPLLTQSTNLNAQLDIPLVFRRSLIRGAAWAEIEKEDETLRIILLNGNPELRAVLFETLIRKKSIRILEEIFKTFNTSQIKISLNYSTDAVSTSDFEFKTTQKIFSNEIELHTLRFLKSPHFGASGFIIDDEHAKKAREKDRQALSELKKSPAYNKVIKEYFYSL